MSSHGSPFALSVNDANCGNSIQQLLERLYPICRSITGDGLRTTLKILSEFIPLDFIEVPSGSPVFDWNVPDEWNINDAYIKNSKGERIVDFRKSNLHVVSYSIPVHQRMSLAELRPHLHTLPNLRNAIPYLTSYYKKDWGFCLTHADYEALEDGEYEVYIGSRLVAGSMTLAECVLPGTTAKEVLLSTYCCHPSLANNELSGPIIVALVYEHLAALERRRYTYRFFFGSETIGTLAYLSLRGEHLKKSLAGGFVVTCCGDKGNFTYKKPRDPKNILDKAVLHSLKHNGIQYQVMPFFPTGSDERQYCSPGFNLPMGSIMRSVYGTYAEYHTSLDNLDFVTVPSMLETLKAYLNCIYALENNRLYRNLKPFGEPKLIKYGLYPSLGGQKEQSEYTRQLRFILNFSDGQNDLIDIADRLDLPIWSCEKAVNDLLDAGLLQFSDD